MLALKRLLLAHLGLPVSLDPADDPDRRQFLSDLGYNVIARDGTWFWYRYNGQFSNGKYPTERSAWAGADRDYQWRKVNHG
jgi:hypothetical protein